MEAGDETTDASILKSILLFLALNFLMLLFIPSAQAEGICGSD
jgi:hypothetical protein